MYTLFRGSLKVKYSLQKQIYISTNEGYTLYYYIFYILYILGDKKDLSKKKVRALILRFTLDHK